MARIFLSYSRIDRPFVEALADKLRRIYGHDNVWFDEGLHGGDIWWEEILEQIASRDIFIYVLSNDSVQSDYCQAEFTEARRVQKQIITVQARDRTRLTDELGDIHYINMANGVDDADALTDLFRSVNKRMIKVPKGASQPLWEPATPRPSKVEEKPRPTDTPNVDTPTLGIPRAEREYVLADNRPWWKKPEFIIGAILVPILVAVLGACMQSMGSNNIPQLPATTEVTQLTDEPDPTQATNADDARATGTAQAYATLTGLAPTNTPTITPHPTDRPNPLQAAFTPVTRNADWTPVERNFDGVTMVLVPAGCFDMGSEDGYEDEQPVHEICFNDPFWIDKYEVTNEQYGSVGCDQWPSEANQPRNCVDWFEASDHCDTRGTRLSTEAEWEYAARGPDSWIYPWGNAFHGEIVNFCDSNCGNSWADANVDDGFEVTAPVGSYDNDSWVGALDMSGNVWEWTSSLYREYPYDDDHESNSDTSSERVLRGGSFSYTSDVLRSANRNRDFPVVSSGFRCALSYE